MLGIGIDVRGILFVWENIDLRPTVFRSIDEWRTKREDFIRCHFVDVAKTIHDQIFMKRRSAETRKDAEVR